MANRIEEAEDCMDLRDMSQRPFIITIFLNNRSCYSSVGPFDTIETRIAFCEQNLIKISSRLPVHEIYSTTFVHVFQFNFYEPLWFRKLWLKEQGVLGVLTAG